MDYEIVLSALEGKSSEFESLLSQVSSFSEEGTSDLSSMSGTEISGLYDRVHQSMERLKNGYTNCNTWLSSYISDLNSLESSLANFSCSNIDAPTAFKGEFIDLFGKKVIPTLKTGGDKDANLKLGSKGSSNNRGATRGELEDARIGSDRRPDYSGFFLSTSDGGFNPFPLNGGGGGVGGNCTYYAYSRFSEIMGEEASTISHGDACQWWDDSYGYKKGQEPRLGAIAVWQYGNSDSLGHVAIVERIEENGDIVISQGGWSNCDWYSNDTISAENGYALDYSNGHLLGFIYPEKE